MRKNHPTTQLPSPAPAPARGWWRAAIFIPVGFAATRALGDGAPLWAPLLVAVVAAFVHYVAPETTEMALGASGLVITLLHATDGRGTGELLGSGAAAVVLLFGTFMLLSAFVQWLSPLRPHRAGRHLIVATAVLELGLFTVSPLGQTVVSSQDTLTMRTLLGSVLLVATPIGVRSDRGLRLIGVGLVLTQGVLVATGDVTGFSPLAALLGSVVFALVALFLEGSEAEAEADDAPPLATAR